MAKSHKKESYKVKELEKPEEKVVVEPPKEEPKVVAKPVPQPEPEKDIRTLAKEKLESDILGYCRLTKQDKELLLTLL